MENLAVWFEIPVNYKMEVAADTNINETVKSSAIGVLKNTKEVTVGVVDVVAATTVKALKGSREHIAQKSRDGSEKTAAKDDSLP